MGPPDGERRWVRDERRREGLARLGPLDEELAHVRQVEQACRRPDGTVLRDDPAVLEWHEPAAELDELGSERLVAVDERGDVRRLLEDVGHEAASPGTSRRPPRSSVIASMPAVPVASASAAWATNARSVSKVSRPPASANATQRTASNSWS